MLLKSGGRRCQRAFASEKNVYIKDSPDYLAVMFILKDLLHSSRSMSTV